MRIFRIVPAGSVLSILLTAAILCAAPGKTQNVWRTNFLDAWAEAKRLDRPMLLHFHAEWCGPCRQMDRDVLNQPELLHQLGRSFVAVKIDSDEHPELVRQFKINALPSDVFIDPAGSVMARNEGYQHSGEYFSQVVQIEAKFVQSQKIRIAKQGPSTSGHDSARRQSNATNGASAPSNSTASQSAGSVSSRANRPVLGLDGYSPVAISESRKWRRGKKNFAARYQGVTYLMATTEEFQEFRVDPGRYAPRLLGCDPVVLWNTDRAVAGSTEYGAYFDGDLFLFVTAKSRNAFKANPVQFTRMRNVLRIDQIDPTRIR